LDIVDREELAALRDEQARRRRVSSILLRLPKYVRGYLPDFPMETHEDLSGNPVQITVKVWWKPESQSQATSERKPV
jgi:hypothetical protein